MISDINLNFMTKSTLLKLSFKNIQKKFFQILRSLLLCRIM